MVYQDIIDWIQRMEGFGLDRDGVEDYIRGHQQGTIYKQQQEALDFYFGAEEPIEAQRPAETLEKLQRGQEAEVEAQREVVPVQENEPTSPLPPTAIPETEQERQSLARRLFRAIRRTFGHSDINGF